MAMSTLHTTLRGTIHTHHLVRRTKGEVMAMTMGRTIELPTPLPPHSVLPMNSRPTTLTTIRIIASQAILLQLLARPHEIGKRRNTNDRWRKRLDRVRPNIRESLRKRTASIEHNGMRCIRLTPVRHLVRVGPATDLMRQTLTRATSDSLTSGGHCKGNT